MRYRYHIRENGVLDSLNVFSALNPQQRERMLGYSTLREYAHGACICRQGEIDDQYFVLVEVRGLWIQIQSINLVFRSQLAMLVFICRSIVGYVIRYG
jgi:hypothetical protein